MLIVKCAKCKTKLIKYRKIGKGRLLRCYKDRIVENFTLKSGEFIVCPKCGEIVGMDSGVFYKVKQRNITYSGSYE